MAEGFLKSIDKDLKVFSAGTIPAKNINSNAVNVMRETGIDISNNVPEDVEKYLNHSFDFVITVCDNAKESCPVFTGDVKHKLHIGFEDPAEAQGTDEQILNTFRKVRDQIKKSFYIFYLTEIIPQ